MKAIEHSHPADLKDFDAMYSSCSSGASGALPASCAPG
jgi:hypothetical protein